MSTATIASERRTPGQRNSDQLERQFVALSGAGLTIEEFAHIARNDIPVMLDKTVEAAVTRCQQALEARLDQGELIYGVNTGFGGNVRFAVARSDLKAHQESLLRFLCCGTGTPLPIDVTRGAMILRANALANGFLVFAFQP